jgi:uncharacterized protein
LVDSQGRFVWYELATTDMEAAKAFYSSVVGWSVLDASIPGMPFALFTAADTSVSGLMLLSEDAEKNGARPRWIGYVGVPDVDAAVERARRLGGAVRVPPTEVPQVSRFSIIADPQNAAIGVFKWLRPGHQQPAALETPGHVGWHELLAGDSAKVWGFYSELFGWERGSPETGRVEGYQPFSTAGEDIGGIVTKPPRMPSPIWLYYFSVGDIDAAGKRVKAAGGHILDGPFEISEGSWALQCTDAQGALFALAGTREKAIGYFERPARGRADAPSRRWVLKSSGNT